MVGYIARLLLEAGERPAILTRGYGRRRTSDEVTIVSDGTAIRAGVDSSGDEPLMLARALPGVAVVVGGSRYHAGRLAENELGATVHVLDDGFQHLQVERDVDLLLLSEEDLSDRPLPGGRLREPLTAAAVADAALVSAGYSTAVDRVARTAGIRTAFQVTRTLGAPRTIANPSGVCRRAVAVARVCDGGDCAARAFLFRCRGRGVGSRRLDELSRPPSLLRDRTSSASPTRRAPPRRPSF